MAGPIEIKLHVERRIACVVSLVQEDANRSSRGDSGVQRRGEAEH